MSIHLSMKHMITEKLLHKFFLEMKLKRPWLKMQNIMQWCAKYEIKQQTCYLPQTTALHYLISNAVNTVNTAWTGTSPKW